MGASGIKLGTPRYFPVMGTVKDVETRGLTTNAFGEGENNEYGVLIDENGNAQLGYMGDEHSVSVDETVMKSTGTFTHRHPDNYFGGSFSMTDLQSFAKSNLTELRAFTKQGQLYSIKPKNAGENMAGSASKNKLLKWVSGHKKMFQQNLNSAYRSALKNATTIIQTGPHAGKVKIASGKSASGATQYKYVNPMTPKQADAYARQWAVGTVDRAYKKALDKLGFTYTVSKAGT